MATDFPSCPCPLGFDYHALNCPIDPGQPRTYGALKRIEARKTQERLARSIRLQEQMAEANRRMGVSFAQVAEAMVRLGEVLKAKANERKLRGA